ncbi:MAG: hypothetical protein R3A45_01185 [Bdellovibrionota bacterium]
MPRRPRDHLHGSNYCASADPSSSTTFTIPEKLVFEPFAELPSRHPEKITSDYIQSVKVNDVSQDATQVVMEVILNLEKVPVAMIPQGVDFNINYKLVDDADQLDDIIVLNPKRNQNSGFAPGPAGQTFSVTESRNLKIPAPDQYTMFTLFVQFANSSTAELVLGSNLTHLSPSQRQNIKRLTRRH